MAELFSFFFVLFCCFFLKGIDKRNAIIYNINANVLTK